MTVIGGKQRDKAPTKENGSLYDLDPQLSQRRTQENERESRLY